jgi:hypothetical protein
VIVVSLVTAMRCTPSMRTVIAEPTICSSTL